MSNVKTKVTPAKLMKLAEEMIDFMTKRELFYDVFIYVNNKRIASNIYSSDHPEKYEKKTTAKGSEYYISKDAYKGSDYVEYANDDTITMTFEGPFYHEYNGNYGSYKIQEAFDKLPEKYGLFFEQGYAWSLSAYEV